MVTINFGSVLLPAVVAVLTGCAAGGPARTSSSEPIIRVGSDESSKWTEVTLENSIYRAVIRLNPGGGEYGNEHAIRDWVLKENNVDQVAAFIDACAQRGPLRKATIVRDETDAKTVRLEYSGAGDEIIAVSEMTVFRDSPVIRIDYLKYPEWTNTVDIGEPGGPRPEPDEGLFAAWAQTRVYGQEVFKIEYGRDPVYHEDSYWNTFDPPYRDTDPQDGGPLSYRGHMIMAVADKATGIGFGRVMPVKAPGKGGIKILKLLWNRGFECFPATGQEERPPFTGYIFVFSEGLDGAMEMGKRIADGDMLIGHQAN